MKLIIRLYVNPGGLTASDKILTVETGGHTTILAKQCSNQYGYVGHRVNGSMGNGTAVDGNDSAYNFTATGELNLCAALAAQAEVTPIASQQICQGSSILLNAVPGGGTFSLTSSNATLSGNQLDITGPGDVHLIYDMPSSCGGSPTPFVLQQSDFGNLDPTIWPVASATASDDNDIWVGINAPNTDCGTNIADSADGLAMIGATGTGSAINPWAFSGSGNSYTAQVTVNGAGIPKPVYWAIWYDVDGNGTFNDSIDIFQNGITTNGGPVSTTFNITVPYGNGETSGKIRLAATGENTVFTKTMNGSVTILNGEIEDYFVTYTTPLPTRLISFNAVKHGNNAGLTWTTESEQNNRGFGIERSTDNKVWSAVSFVTSKAVSGNSHQKTDYGYNDQSPAGGINYYRLKQMDKDGKFVFSEIRTLMFTGNGKISITPNPTSGVVSISGLQGDETISVTNVAGKQLMDLQARSSICIFNISYLAEGVYYVNIKNNNGSRSIKILRR